MQGRYDVGLILAYANDIESVGKSAQLGLIGMDDAEKKVEAILADALHYFSLLTSSDPAANRGALRAELEKMVSTADPSQVEYGKIIHYAIAVLDRLSSG